MALNSSTILLQATSLSDDVIADIVSRESALWIDDTYPLSAENIDALAELISLPWRLVLCELTNVTLFESLKSSRDSTGNLLRRRGFLYPMASDPTGVGLPARALPIFFLNGVDGATNSPESNTIGRIGATRRRLNMLTHLSAISPRRLIVVGDDPVGAAEELSELWGSEYRGLITFICSPENAQQFSSVITTKLAAVPLKTLVAKSMAALGSELVARVTSLLPDESIRVRLRDKNSNYVIADITEADFVEQPIRDSYDIIEFRDIISVATSDLSQEDFSVFFGKEGLSWRPFAAGLPWIKDPKTISRLVDALEGVYATGPDENCLLQIISEPGAGGTTLARTLAYEAAKRGFLTLLAKPHLAAPNPTELASFLFRSRSLIRGQEDPGAESTDTAEVPALVVFDTEQWSGQENAISDFLTELSRSGRPVVALKVFGSTTDSALSTRHPTTEIAYLTHELESSDVESLGTHLNRYLVHLGHAKPKEEWQQFWINHRPDVDTPIASFWIALEFWLKGLLDLGEPIQEWLLKQFKSEHLDTGARPLILELAALSIERRSIPEGLLQIPNESELPLSVLLENARKFVPGLALIRYNSPMGRMWAVAHDVLGRYLLNSVYYDRPLIDQLGLSKFQSPVELRLHIISSLAAQPELGHKFYLSYAVQFATKTLKLDERDGNAEFFPLWEKVLSALESVPVAVRKTSRTFNHHVAISRRRVSKSELFGATTDQKRDQLNKAVADLEFSLGALEPTLEDESNLNLYNSLALAYQDLAEVELSAGSSSELVQAYRLKASEATRNALKESPTNPYVLETAARNLIQQGRLDTPSAVSSAAEALGYVFRASTLDTSVIRQRSLGKLVDSALLLLTQGDADSQIENLLRTHNPLGFLAKAWVILLSDRESDSDVVAYSFSISSTSSAIEVLREAPKHWLVLTLLYELQTRMEPHGFEEQLRLLDELDTFPSFTTPLQLKLERTILLYMVGRHSDATKSFRTLRSEIKQSSSIISVPDRLRWLLTPDRRARLICNARVVDEANYRSTAKIQELGGIDAPFVPQQFGNKRMPPRMAFRCYVSFGAMGPFVRPPLQSSTDVT